MAEFGASFTAPVAASSAGARPLLALCWPRSCEPDLNTCFTEKEHARLASIAKHRRIRLGGMDVPGSGVSRDNSNWYLVQARKANFTF